MNRGKKGVCIDLKTSVGVELFKELIAVSDVLGKNTGETESVLESGAMGKKPVLQAV